MVNTTRAIFRTQSNIYDGAFFVKIVNGSLPLTPSTPPSHFCMSIMRILLNARIIHYPRYNMNNKIKTYSMHCSLQLFLYILLLAFRTVLDTAFFSSHNRPTEPTLLDGQSEDNTAWKVSRYGGISGQYFPVFSPNAGKYGPEIFGHFSRSAKVHILCMFLLEGILKQIWKSANIFVFIWK